MCPKGADGMANSVDPDLTATSEAVWSGSTLFANTCVSENLGPLQYVLMQYQPLLCLHNPVKFLFSKHQTLILKEQNRQKCMALCIMLTGVYIAKKCWHMGYSRT